jgi:3-oxoacyl-(acyl-carrier-protein) synthase
LSQAVSDTIADAAALDGDATSGAGSGTGATVTDGGDAIVRSSFHSSSSTSVFLIVANILLMAEMLVMQTVATTGSIATSSGGDATANSGSGQGATVVDGGDAVVCLCLISLCPLSLYLPPALFPLNQY